MSRESVISRTQYGIYLECISNPEATTYNFPALLYIPASVPMEAIRESIIKTIEAHEALTSRPYSNARGEVVLRSGYPIETKTYELSDEEFADRKNNLVRPFSMEGEALARIELYITPSQKYMFADFSHLVVDGTSFNTIFTDFFKVLNGEEIQPEAFTCHDINDEEQDLRNSEEYDKAKKFYTDIFEGLDTDCTPYPNVTDVPKAQGWLNVTADMDVNLLDELKKKYGISRSAFFVAAAGYTIARYNYTKQSIISTVYSGRTNPDYNRTVTMLVKTMPMVIDFENENSVIELLKKVQNNLTGSRNNTLYSFLDAASDLGINNDINVAYQGSVLDFDSRVPQGFHIERLYDPAHIEETKLLLEINDISESKMGIHFGYRKDCYSDDWAQTFADSFATVCRGFLTHANLNEVSLCDEKDIALLDSFNDNHKKFNTAYTLVQRFRETADKYPDNTAVVYKDIRITYKELDKITDNLAGFLIKEGVGTNKAAAILVPRCEYMVITALSVMKAGGIYLPLDPTYPKERLNLMVSDAEAVLLITTHELSPVIEDEFTGKRVLLSDIPQICETDYSREEIVKYAPSLDDVFILLYTSGSTGVPKGVRLMQRNIIATSEFVVDYEKIDSASRVAAYASFGFDANMLDTYPTLISGAQLHIIEEDMRLDLARIHKYFDDNKISHAFMTTQIGRQFAGMGELPDFKILSTGGEKLPSIEPPAYRLLNLYGPTETTIFITYFEVDKYYKDIPIGKAVDNMSIYIVDSDGNRLPVGAAGELWVAGPQVSAGYLNRPDKTSEVFIANPFSNEKDYSTVYRTGDVVSYMPDGNIRFIGRRDGQVKIRGFRIELSEVEEILRRFPEIQDATTAVYDDPSGGKYIAAYVVGKDGMQVDIKAMNQFIMEEKPPYMVPAVTMQIDAIPYNQNQKVNKRALPAPVRTSESKAAPSVSYDNAITAKLKEILNSILGENQYDNCEDLSFYGLNSLGMIRLVSLISEEFSVECSVSALRKGCSIRSLEEIIIAGLLTKKEPASAPEAKVKADKVPLSGAQMGVYAECIKNPLDSKYNVPFYFEFSLDMDTDKLSKAVEKVMKAHPSVFSTIVIDGENICQKRAEEFNVDIPVVELKEAELDGYMEECKQPVNLMNSRLFRIEIVKTEKSVYLFTVFHHIVFDGTSMGIFTAQLKDVLEGREIEAEQYDYFDYVTDRNSDEDAYKKAEEYFAKMLSQCEKSDEISPDLTGNLEDGGLGISTAPFDMSKVDDFCHAHKITPAHLFLAAIFYVVSRFTNSRNAYISTISNGRADIRTNNTFGMFVNTLALGIEIGDISVAEFLEQSKDIFNGAMDNEIYPFARMAAKFNYAADIFYAYQIGINEATVINGQKIEIREIGERAVKFKTGIYIERENDDTVINVVYNTARFSKSLMDTLSKCILATVYGMIDNPDGPVRKLSMLLPEDAGTIEEFSARKIEEPKNKILHKLFEEQVSKTPDTIALKAIDGSLTYEELNKMANKVANALDMKGISPSAKVVLLLERTSKYFAALFGVLKAGGAFIPTCPDYPGERICSIIEDSEAEYVITYGDFVKEYDNALDIDELLKCDNTEAPDKDVKSDDLAYLIYTSGSTGKPKGVMLSHGGIANYLTDNEYNPQIHLAKENCRCFGSVTTVSFDMNFKETLNALCNGLTLAFASDEMTMNPVLLGQFFTENNVDVFNATPSRLLAYMEIPEFEQAMKNCKLIMSGGEGYPAKLLEVIREKTSARILNTYGPTEITVSSNAAELTDAEYISIGKPLYNYKEYIVDIDDNKLPANVVGELLIGGVGVAKGYNKLPEQTKNAFIEYEGMRFYRSGDYARFTDKGDVMILGRKDNQIKLRGLRIELDEIEKVLTAVEGVHSGKVLIRKLGKEDEICAYYTSEREIPTEELKTQMAKKLTDYMIPAAFVRLDEMPLTPNGKINVKMLPEPVVNTKDRKIEAPANKTEEDFCRIFKEVLGIDTVSATDSFFDIGGTSLAVVSVVVKASKLNYEVSFSDIFDNPSPRKLAVFVSGTSEKSVNPFGSIADYDYSAINKVLEGNNLEAFTKGESQEIGDVILAGATGFLGIHMLYTLLTKYKGKVCCLLRRASKLPLYFNYYFEDVYYDDFIDRITIIDGDITKPEAMERLKSFKADTFINCAANVKHFSEGTDIEDVNYYGVKNIISYCKDTGTRLIHVSTMSIGGLYYDNMGPVDQLKENMLFINQNFNSKYTNSKYLAEREILEAVAGGMNAKIMRVGNLSARDADGLFQMNFRTNTSMGRIKAAYVLGAHTYSSMKNPIEFSPIGDVAEAILLLGQTPKECVVFHPFNNHAHIMEEVYTAMNEVGLPTEAVNDEEYSEILMKAEQDPAKAKILSSFMAYERADGRKTFMVGKSNDYTMQVLYRMDFRWAVSSLEYMRSFLIMLKELGFFEW